MKTLVCIECPRGCKLEVTRREGKILVSGNRCPRGQGYAERELVNPSRTLTTTVRTSFADFPLLPVRTDGEVPLDSIPALMERINTVQVSRRLLPGDVVTPQLPGTHVALIATAAMTALDTPASGE